MALASVQDIEETTKDMYGASCDEDFHTAKEARELAETRLLLAISEMTRRIETARGIDWYPGADLDPIDVEKEERRERP